MIHVAAFFITGFVAAALALVVASFWSLDLQWARFLSAEALARMGRFLAELLAIETDPAFLRKLLPAALIAQTAGEHHDDHHGHEHAHAAGGIEWEDGMVEVSRVTTPANTRWKIVDRSTGDENQAIQWMLADMATELDAARMLTWKAADSRQRQRGGGTEPGPLTLDAAMAKLYASEAAHRAADKAMQILASHGYRRGSLVERLFRDARATEIYQGTSEIQRMVIAEHILD